MVRAGALRIGRVGREAPPLLASLANASEVGKAGAQAEQEQASEGRIGREEHRRLIPSSAWRGARLGGRRGASCRDGLGVGHGVAHLAGRWAGRWRPKGWCGFDDQSRCANHGGQAYGLKASGNQHRSQLLIGLEAA